MERVRLTEVGLRKLIKQVIAERGEPFDMEIVSQLRNINTSLDRLAMNTKFDEAEPEIAAAQASLRALVTKLRQVG